MFRIFHFQLWYYNCLCFCSIVVLLSSSHICSYCRINNSTLMLLHYLTKFIYSLILTFFWSCLIQMMLSDSFALMIIYFLIWMRMRNSSTFLQQKCFAAMKGLLNLYSCFTLMIFLLYTRSIDMLCPLGNPNYQKNSFDRQLHLWLLKLLHYYYSQVLFSEDKGYLSQ